MKRLLASILFLAVLGGITHAAYFQAQTYAPSAVSNPNLREENVFGVKGSAWQDPSGWGAPGAGNPAISTADAMGMNGLYWFRPNDLTNSACGSAGASIAAAKGRYVWFASPDHSGGNYAWNGGNGFVIGYSNDPGVFPATMDRFYLDALTNPAQIATINASISGNTLTVNSISTGLITNDNHAFITGAGVTQANIVSQQTGTSGLVGTYTIDGAPQLVASVDMVVSQSNAGLYHTPFLVCNPDDATYPFYVYGEGFSSVSVNQETLLKSGDLVTWSYPAVSHVKLRYDAWSSFQNVTRDGVNSWHSLGFQSYYFQTGNTFARSKWTSANGRDWTLGTSNLNQCIPASAQVGTSTNCTGTNVLSFGLSSSPDNVSISGQSWQLGTLYTFTGGTRVGNQWVGRAPIDANYNVIDTPTNVKVSSAYAGYYPGPTYLQSGNAYVEDGIAHYYAQVGFPTSSGLFVTVDAAPYLNGGSCLPTNSIFEASGNISGTTLTISSTNGAIGTNTQIIYGAASGRPFITGQLNGTPGGAGQYTVSISQTVTATFTISTCGGLWQQGIDYYTEVIDATAAASAAPVGVKASCASGTASLTWFNSLPHQNYRVYRGTSAGSQPTLVGDVTGTSTTNVPGGTGVYYYKVVTLNGGEQQSRVVSTYCSSSSAFVNAHMTRALAAGADASTCNRTIMDSFDAWLTSNGLQNNLRLATSVYFCVAKDGSNVISKIFDMGTTRLPRSRDYTPNTSNTTYNATAINSNPAWVNTSSAYGYYGGGKSGLNNIRRQTQITLFAAYQKPGTGQVTPFITGQFGGRIELTHTSGAPGAANFYLYDATTNKTAAVNFSGNANDFHTMAGVFDGTNAIAYADGVAGSPQSGLVIPSPNLNPPDALTGQVGYDTGVQLLGSGGDQSLFLISDGFGNGNPIFGGNRAGYSGVLQAMFDIGLSPSQNASLNTLVRGWQGL